MAEENTVESFDNRPNNEVSKGKGLPVKLIIGLLVVVIISLAAYIFLTPPQVFTEIDQDYAILYGNLEAIKHLEITQNSHFETITLATASPELDYALFTIIPKTLASDIKDARFTTNGKIQIINTDLQNRDQP